MYSNNLAVTWQILQPDGSQYGGLCTWHITSLNRPFRQSLLNNIPQNKVAWDLVLILKNEKKSLKLRFSKWLWKDSNHQSSDYKSNALTTRLPTAAAESTENLCYLCTDLINVYCGSPDPDPNSRGVNCLTLRVQFYANECNEGRDANP